MQQAFSFLEFLQEKAVHVLTHQMEGVTSVYVKRVAVMGTRGALYEKESTDAIVAAIRGKLKIDEPGNGII